MKNLRSRFVLAGLLLLVLLAISCADRALAVVFYRNLTIGDVGEDVRQLQVFLNKSPDTTVAFSGIGSHGLESTYFGELTANAVVRFQEKYASEILYPVGLTNGTGYVGPSTLAALNRLSAETVSAVSSTTVTIPPHLNQTSQSPVAITYPVATTSPNMKNFDKFTAAVDRVATKKGISASVIAQFKAQARIDAATTTDLRKVFISKLRTKGVTEINNGSLFGQAVFGFADMLEKTFTPKEALASTLNPFGGELLYTFFCGCSYTWILLITPLPPDYVVLLSYYPFSQAYLNYNIPYTENLLGKYYSGEGECSIYYGYGCATIPTEGLISPIVGSSTF